MNRSVASLGVIASLVLTVWISPEVRAHEEPGSALQLFSFEADLVPAPIDGDISPDGGESKWSSAYLRSVIFASVDGSITRPGTIFLTNDESFLYVGVGFNSGSASGQNYAAVYFDQDHDHALAGDTAVPGEYYVKVTGSDPGEAENGGWYGANGWQSYGAVFPAGLEAVAQKHGSGNPQTFNFEFKIPLSSLPGSSGESFLDVTDTAEIGLLVQVFDTSDGLMYWEPTGRDPADASAWGETQLGLRGPERQMASSIALGHLPVIDGNVADDPEWQHYTTVSRTVLLTNYEGDFVEGTLRSKSNATDVYLALELDGRAAFAGDRLNVFLDYDATTGGDLDFILEHLTEDGAAIVYSGTGTGDFEDLHFENAPTWAIDSAADGEGAVSHNGAGYEFELRIPLAGTGTEDLQVVLGALIGMNLEFVDSATGLSYWWDVSTNSRFQQVRVDATNYTALGWSSLQTGAPVVQPVFPRDGDEVSGHYPFTIYATAAGGELDIVSAEFSDDLGLTWKTLTRVDEDGLWTKTWDTTILPDGPREIRLRVTDVNGLRGTLVLGVVIDNTSGGPGDRPVVTATAPAAGSWVTGTTDIEFTVTPGPGQTILSTDVSIDGGPWVPGASPFPWDTTLGEDGSHIFQVRAVQSDSLLGTSDPRLVLVDNTAPDVEALSIRYPDGQTAAKAGDVVLVTALVRDDGVGLDPATVSLDSGSLDGASHVLVDDGTNGDVVAGDGLWSFAVTVTSTATATVSVSLEAADVLGNLAPAVTADVELDNADPALVSTSSGDADTIYKNTDVVRLVTAWDGAGYRLTADFSAIDGNWIAGAEQITDNGDGTYTIVYEISFENALPDGAALPVAITAWDVAGNGPVVDSGFTVELDNTPPGFDSVDADRDNYMDGDTIVLTAAMDDSTYAVSCDFGSVDSGYSTGAESVSRTGNVYTITYVISADPQNTTPDGSYTLTVEAEDVAGNTAAASTSVELDNTPEAPVILEPRDGQLLTAEVLIDVTSPDDTRFVRFQVSPDDGATWYNLDGTQSPTDYTEDSDATDGWSRVWNTATDALPDGVAYRIRVTAWDEQDPVSHLIGQDEVGGGLVVDNTPPSLDIAIAPVPSDGPLTGEVFQPEITLTGSFFDFPDSARVVAILVEHRNEDGDHVNDSPIHIPASGFTFSRILRLLEGRNDLLVTAQDEAGLTFSRSAEIRYLVPEEATPIGPEGGTVEAPDGTSVVIPAGALLRTENISIVRVPEDELPPTVDQDLTLLKRAHHFGPDGLIFHRPVRITLTYTDADLDRDQDGVPDWDEGDLNAYFWEGASWVKTNTPDRRSQGNTLSFQVNHFSTFDIGVISRGVGDSRLYWTRNPFRPDDGTTCVFELPEDGIASLKIYDLTGQRVATVANKKRVSSSSSLRWDGRNDFDRFVGSGVYVYVFEFEGDQGASLMFRKPLGVVK